ncbi:MAG: sugar ABC transporter permease [Caldilineaceae bacterium]|nr:sugar ABC transporter permease [Caldilineaceae bacterium]
MTVSAQVPAPSQPVAATPPRPRWSEMSGLARREAIEGYLFLLPNIIAFFVFLAGPMLAAVYFAFTNYDLTWPPRFTFLENFQVMFNNDLFWQVFGQTFYWAFGMVPATIVLALGLAMMINREMRGVLTYRLVYFIPHVTLSVAASIVWLWVYHPDVGFLNLLLSYVGIDGPQWLLNRRTAMPSLILMGWWKSIGFAMLIFLAGLQGIPAELYEAAVMDGANPRQRFWAITVPMLSPAIFFVMVTSIIGAFQGFDVFYLMTRGGPANATTTMVLHIYNNGFLYLKMGFASAMAMVLFATIMLFTLGQWLYARNWVHGFAD